MEENYLIEKRGLYYRPNSAGYTGLKSEAGRYSFEDASVHAGPNGPDGSTDGMGIWREHEAPEFSSRCPWDVKLVTQARAEGREAGLREAAEACSHRADMCDDFGLEMECCMGTANNCTDDILALIDTPPTEGGE